MKMFPTVLAVCALLGALSATRGQSPTITYSQGAGTGTAIPGGTGNFTSFPSAPSVGAGGPVFAGTGSGGQYGVYLPPQPQLDITSTAIPWGDWEFYNSTVPLGFDEYDPD